MGTSPGFIRGQVPSASQWNGYFAGKADDLPVIRIVPTNGQTHTTAIGVGTLIMQPAGELATLTVIAPPSPRDQQKFTIVSTDVIDAGSVSTSDGTTILGAGPLGFSANSGVTWQFLEAQNTWYRIQG